MIPITASMLWLLFGIALLLLEFVQLPGIGFLFLGLGGVSTAIITNYWQEQTVLAQFAYFGLSSLFCFALLWYPLKSSLYKNTLSKKETFDLVGSQVTVIKKEIKVGIVGEVSWCGTIMKAELAEDTNSNTAKIGDILVVQEVRGNVLICSKNTK
ncbi:NfeD family protein [Rickettsiaceae bacterium]|nr:NfeD family protein [Rickettsiaceae bacterium]